MYVYRFDGGPNGTVLNMARLCDDLLRLIISN